MTTIEAGINSTITQDFFKLKDIDYKKPISVPSKDDIRFSVELEFVNASKHRVKDDVTRNKLPWRVISDASLYNNRSIDSDKTGEALPNNTNILKFKNKKLKEIDNITDIIKSHGGIADEHCGVHVHVDGKSFVNNSQMSRLVSNVYNVQTILTKIVNMRKNGYTYSRPIPDYYYKTLKSSKNMKDFRKNWYDKDYIRNVMGQRGNSCWATEPESKYNATRYTLLNIHPFFYKLGTVEFRLFNGTLDIDLIKAYISLCLEIVINSMDLEKTLLYNRKIKSFNEFINKSPFLNVKESKLLNATYKEYLLKNDVEMIKHGNFYIPSTIIDMTEANI